MDGSNSMVLGM